MQVLQVSGDVRLWAFECGALCHCFLLAPTETKADLAGQLGAVGIDSTSLVVEDPTGHTLVSNRRGFLKPG